MNFPQGLYNDVFIFSFFSVYCLLCQSCNPSSSFSDMKGVMIGQNIAAGSSDLVGAIEMWASEVKDFSYGSSPTGVVGHYTQV